MNNLDRYNQIFTDTFNIDNAQLEGLTYQSIPLWDSVGHMTLISTLEDTFGIMVETDDIISFSSYLKGKQILTEKYGLQF